VFKVSRGQAVGSDDSPFVLQHTDFGLTQVDHRFDGEGHARSEHRAGATFAEIGDLRFFVEMTTDAVSHEFTDDGIAMADGLFLDVSTNIAEAAAGIAERVAEAAENTDADVVAGNVIMLQGQRPIEIKEVNSGGLVVVRVPDSSGRPPQNITADGSGQFQRLGQVRGVREQDGKPLADGGYTWILLKPISEGEGSIVLSYTPNDGGAPVKREFKVNVTAVATYDNAN